MGEKYMRWLRKLMEIKVAQLLLERQMTREIIAINNKMFRILELMKGGVKDGKNKNKRNH